MNLLLPKMDKNNVLNALRIILSSVQQLMKYRLIVVDGKFYYVTDDREKQIVIEKPKPFNPAFSSEVHVIDGLVDMLYYIHFCFSDFIEPAKRTRLMSMANQFYTETGADPLKIRKQSFIWRMILSEMFEILSIYGDTYVSDVCDIVPYRDGVNDVRDQLFEVEDSFYKAAWTLGVSRNLFTDAFEIVHNANMGKKFPDGTFHKSSIGKVEKGPNWREPDLMPIVARLHQNASYPTLAS